MEIRFIHTADIHLGKTYRNSPGEAERYEDFFRCLSGIVEDALLEFGENIKSFALFTEEEIVS